MYARVVFGEVRPEQENVVVQLYRDWVAPAARQQNGFKGIIQMADPNTGKTLSITLWESEADMKAGETSDYYKQQFAKLASYDATRPALVGYKVNLLETS
jgi:heme-degrading monooxygenase HmoA